VFTKYTGAGEVGVDVGVFTSGDEKTAGVEVTTVSRTLTWGAGRAVAAGEVGEGAAACSIMAWGGGAIIN
jgi:hypothetical protein